MSFNQPPRYSTHQKELEAEGRQSTGVQFKILPSSFIDDIDYNDGNVLIKISGKWQGPYPMKWNKFMKFIHGEAVCLTTDPTGRYRWHKGKTPSLGAFYNQFVKRSGVRGWRAGRALLARIVRRQHQQKAVNAAAIEAFAAEVKQAINLSPEIQYMSRRLRARTARSKNPYHITHGRQVNMLRARSMRKS